jgi:hypothetical protein
MARKRHLPDDVSFRFYRVPVAWVNVWVFFAGKRHRERPWVNFRAVTPLRACFSNPKHQIRNKFKIEIRNVQNLRGSGFYFWVLKFEFVSGFDIRASNLRLWHVKIKKSRPMLCLVCLD